MRLSAERLPDRPETGLPKQSRDDFLVNVDAAQRTLRLLGSRGGENSQTRELCLYPFAMNLSWDDYL
jgi:hypothetical protein